MGKKQKRKIFLAIIANNIWRKQSYLTQFWNLNIFKFRDTRIPLLYGEIEALNFELVKKIDEINVNFDCHSVNVWD